MEFLTLFLTNLASLPLKSFFFLFSYTLFSNPSVYAFSIVEPSQHYHENIIFIHNVDQRLTNMNFIKTQRKSFNYNTCALNYRITDQPIDKIKKEVEEQIQNCIIKFNKTNKTHFIIHPLGGVIIQQYLSKHPTEYAKKKINKIIILETSNHGITTKYF